MTTQLVPAPTEVGAQMPPRRGRRRVVAVAIAMAVFMVTGVVLAAVVMLAPMASAAGGCGG